VVLLLAGSGAIAWEARIANLERAKAQRRFADLRKLASPMVFEVNESLEEYSGATPAESCWSPEDWSIWMRSRTSRKAIAASRERWSLHIFEWETSRGTSGWLTWVSGRRSARNPPTLAVKGVITAGCKHPRGNGFLRDQGYFLHCSCCIILGEGKILESAERKRRSRTVLARGFFVEPQRAVSQRGDHRTSRFTCTRSPNIGASEETKWQRCFSTTSTRT
jgi:hypothetical protein